MTRYAAFLRGVSPMNARMPDVKRSFEAAGFTNVKTLLSSGNVVFDADAPSVVEVGARAEAALQAGLPRAFPAIVRPVAHLQALLARDPFAAFTLAPGAKCIVTFLRRPVAASPVALPAHRDGASLLALADADLLAAYVPDEQKGGLFMRFIEAHFGRDITTRTVDTVRRCAEG